MSPDSSNDGEKEEWKFGPQDVGPPDIENMDEEELEQIMRQRREMMTQQSRPTGRVLLTFVLAILMLSVIAVGPVLAVWWLFSFEATIVAIGGMFLWLRFVIEGTFGE